MIVESTKFQTMSSISDERIASRAAARGHPLRVAGARSVAAEGGARPSEDYARRVENRRLCGWCVMRAAPKRRTCRRGITVGDKAVAQRIRSASGDTGAPQSELRTTRQVTAAEYGPKVPLFQLRPRCSTALCNTYPPNAPDLHSWQRCFE